MFSNWNKAYLILISGRCTPCSDKPLLGTVCPVYSMGSQFSPLWIRPSLFRKLLNEYVVYRFLVVQKKYSQTMVTIERCPGGSGSFPIWNWFLSLGGTTLIIPGVVEAAKIMHCMPTPFFNPRPSSMRPATVCAA